MAIGFARLEFVKRSAGQNACLKSAYISRSKIHFHGHEYQPQKTFDWSSRERPAFHEIMLPEHVNKQFLSGEYLWNEIELKESRENSQLALDVVLALPDDKDLSLEDKIKLMKSFVTKQFIDNGLGAEVTIHQPDKKVSKSNNLGQVEEIDHNWHAHVLLTTRRFTNDGFEIGEKARDLMPLVRNGIVVSGPNWGKLWAIHQNKYFEDMGLSLRVDPNGVVGQIHLGPVRLRTDRSSIFLDRNDDRIELNRIDSQDPLKILSKITERQSVFTFDDVERFLQKHVDADAVKEVRDAFWKQENVIQLLDMKTGEALDKFTAKEVINEEEKILRLADRIASKSSMIINSENVHHFATTLNQEQRLAYQNIVNGKRLSLIEGHAGTGKSYLLASLKNAYEDGGYIVRAFGPDNATAGILKEKGFSYSENIYKFLFSLKYKKIEVTNNKEVWIVDESGKLGNRPLMEFFKNAEKHGAQIVLSGCSSQLPSVERGGMFKVLCDKYGHESLFNIQRQEKESQREISKQLAYGKISQAINSIINTGGMRWYESKNESMEELVRKWAIDRIAFPNSSSLIVAHSNAEVNSLNDMIHNYRKEKGELGEKEYECETSSGKIYISVNDEIAFRKKDLQLGLTNGLSGTLIKASPEEFTVSINEEGKTRHVKFDPTEYTHFHLNYASTYHRSQGKTIDRAYVLHSKQINKELFYVGMTRHVQRAYFFVSKEDAYCLSDLKRQALRSCVKPSTLEYLTTQKIEEQRLAGEKSQRINNLKNSQSPISMMKGYAIQGLNNVGASIHQFFERRKDLKADEQFFNPVLKNDQRNGSVKEFDRGYELSDQKLALRNDRNEVFKKVNELAVSDSEASCAITSKKHDKEELWQKLNGKDKALMDNYYASVNQAAALNSIVKLESGGIVGKEKFTPHFNEWMQTCGMRNEHAYNISRLIDQQSLNRLLGEEGSSILLERSKRYELVIQRKENGTLDLQQELKNHFETLVYKLFPEGPERRDKNGFRFGSKGSFSVICRGDNAGSYYDFENGKGGGPLSLIQNKLGLGTQEAKEWARGFLGKAQDIPLPSHYSFRNNSSEKDFEWTSLKPDTNLPAPSLKLISSKLDSLYIESGRHAYRDKDGEVLFHILRLLDKTDPTKKTLKPLSFGFWKGGEHFPKWCLKGYQTNLKPLYNLPQLYKEHKLPIFIVEGEKTADAAAKLNSNIVSITWCGGASAVSKTDWSPLFGRHVIIWPDNDPAGYKAANDICSELRRVGVKSLGVIDKDVLSRDFPQKWDLADPLPVGQSDRVIKDLILGAQEKGVGFINHAALGLKESASLIDKLRLNEIVWRLEERLRPILEEKHASKSWDIKNEVISESLKIFTGMESFGKQLKAEYGMEGSSVERLSYHMALYQAASGNIPSKAKIEDMKQTIASSYRLCQSQGIKLTEHNEIYEHAFDKAVSRFLECGAYGSDLQNRFPSIHQDALHLSTNIITSDKNRCFQLQEERNKQIPRENEI